MLLVARFSVCASDDIGRFEDAGFVGVPLRGAVAVQVQIGVMGGDQAANTLAEVKVNQMKRNGGSVDDPTYTGLDVCTPDNADSCIGG